MELEVPLLRDYRAQEEGYAAAALAGKQPGGDPGAAVRYSDLDLAEVIKESVEKQPVHQENLLPGDSSDQKKEVIKESVERQSVRQENLLPGDTSDQKKEVVKESVEKQSVRQENLLPGDTSDRKKEVVKASVEKQPVRQENLLPGDTSDRKKLEDAPVLQEENKSEGTPIQQEDTGSKKSEDLPIQQEEAGKNCKKGLSDRQGSAHQEVALSIHEVAPTLEFLKQQASALAKSAAGSSMAATAEAFSRAVDHFAAGRDRKKRAMDTEMSKSAMALFSVAQRAPLSEAGLATLAIQLTSDAQMCLLSDTDSKPGLFVRWWRRGSSTSGPEAVKQPSNLKQWLRVALSARKPMLPLHTEREKKLVDKREVLYALALGAPLAILTSAAGLHTFPHAWAWVVGTSVGVWILAASGTVLNQYSQLDCERLAARHLGRLGVLGAALLFCFFAYSAFFPSAVWGFWFLAAIATITLVFPWIVSCIRGDDDFRSGLGSAGDAVENASQLEMPRGGSARRRTI